MSREQKGIKMEIFRENSRFIGCCITAFIMILVQQEGLFAQKPFHLLTNSSGDQTAEWTLEYFEDHGGDFQVLQLSSDELKKLFQPADSSVIVSGDSTAVFWLRLRIKNSLDRKRLLYLETAYPHLDEVSVFLPGENGYRIMRGGDRLQKTDREIEHNTIVFPIEAVPGESNLLVRVASQGLMRMPLQLWSPSAFMSHRMRVYLLNGFFYGALLIMLLYNLIVYGFMREVAYLYPVLLATVVIPGFLSFDGFGLLLLPPGNYWFTQVAVVAYPLMNACIVLFARNQLETRKHWPRLDRGFKICAVIFGLFPLLLLILPYRLFVTFEVRLFTPFALCVLAVLFGVGFNIFRRKKHRVRYYLMGCLVLLLPGLLSPLENMGVLPPVLLLANGGKISMVAFLAILSLGTADRLREMRDTMYDVRNRMKRIKRINHGKGVENVGPVVDKKFLSPAMEKKIQGALEFLEENYTSDISREALAANLNINPDNLGRFFKRYTGQKISDYVNEMRIEAAKKRLRESNEKIIDIAFGVGFETLQTFNRIFNKYTQLTPSLYRKEFRSTLKLELQKEMKLKVYKN